jgi:hypothetical protein
MPVCGLPWPVAVLNVFVDAEVCCMVVCDFLCHGARCLLFLISYLNCCDVNNKENFGFWMKTRCHGVSVTTTPIRRSRDSSVGIAMGYRPVGGGHIFFCTPQRPDWLWDPPGVLSEGYLGLMPGVKRPGFEAEHSFSVPKLRMHMNVHPVFMAWCSATVINYIYCHVYVCDCRRGLISDSI